MTTVHSQSPFFPFENLRENVQEIILSFLIPEELLTIGCLNKKLYSLSRHPRTWVKQTLDFVLNDYSKIELCSHFLKQIKNINLLKIEYDLCGQHETNTQTLEQKRKSIKQQFLQNIEILKVSEIALLNDCMINKLPIVLPEQLQSLTIVGYPLPDIVNPEKLPDFTLTYGRKCHCKQLDEPKARRYQKLQQYSNLKSLFLDRMETDDEEVELGNLKRLGIQMYLNKEESGLQKLKLPKLESLELGFICCFFTDGVFQFINDTETIRMVHVNILGFPNEEEGFKDEVTNQIYDLDKTREFYRVLLSMPEVPVIDFGLNVVKGKCVKKDCTKDKKCHGFYFENLHQ